eukprot:GHVN01091581.1.p2 GENE.GHVN01091581.1~~GHVN01091581.1.p2  ORF type:complete len:173 (-),score=27.66 GHVN01091581.1:144-662(-)
MVVSHPFSDELVDIVAIPTSVVGAEELERWMTVTFPSEATLRSEQEEERVRGVIPKGLKRQEDLWVIERGGKVDVPVKLRERVVAFGHLKGALQGTKRTRNLISRVIRWPGLAGTVDGVVGESFVCRQRRKLRKKQVEGVVDHQTELLERQTPPLNLSLRRLPHPISLDTHT